MHLSLASFKWGLWFAMGSPVVVESSRNALLSAAEAQATSVRRYEKFLDASGVAGALATCEELRPSISSLARDKRGLAALGAWQTYYLHTEDAFRRAAPELVEAIYDAAAAGWPEAATVDRSRLRMRNAEFHEVKAGGALPDVHHFDSGSSLGPASRPVSRTGPRTSARSFFVDTRRST